MAEPIALCLSGGGLRATLFHFGLLKAMRAHSKNGVTALSELREVYSVSGGSITAAHLVRNWKTYNGTAADIDGLQSELLAFARRSIRDRVVRRWILTRAFGRRRSYWLQQEYSQLLGSGSIADCYTDTAALPPAIAILATSFTTGELCSFSQNDFEIEPTRQGDAKHVTAGGHIPLAYAVAASSAFPPLFPPVALTPGMLRQPADNYFADTILLSDGGVFDNLGFEKFQATHQVSDGKVATLIVSNAGGSFRTGGKKTYGTLVSRNVRASDILMRRVGDATERTFGGGQLKLNCINLRIGDVVKTGSPSVATQQLLRLVRTDLDIFDTALAGMLIDHGYRVGKAYLQKQGWAETAPLPPCIQTLSDGDQANVASVAADRTMLSFWFDIRDWKTVPPILVVAVLIVTLLLSALASPFLIRHAANVEKTALVTQGAMERTALAEKAKLAQKTLEDQRAAHIKALNAQADILQNIRRAAATGNLAMVEKVLAGNIVASEEMAGRPNAVIDPNSVRLDNQQVRQIIDETRSYTVPPQPSPHNQPVYIQFAGVLTRPQIIGINQALKLAGWNTKSASGERTPKAAGLNEVRYGGNNAAVAGELASALNASGIIPGNKIVAKPLSIVGPNNLEVWISR